MEILPHFPYIPDDLEHRRERLTREVRGRDRNRRLLAGSAARRTQPAARPGVRRVVHRLVTGH